LLLAIVLSVLLACADPAIAQTPTETLDANTLPKVPDGGTNTLTFVNKGGPAIAQTFTATRSGTLTTAQLQVFKHCTSAGDLKMQISSTSGGTPTDDILAEATVAASDIPLGSEALGPYGELVTVHFSSPATVEAGKQYALIERLAAPEQCPSSDFDDPEQYVYPMKQGDVYPSGHTYGYSMYNNPLGAWRHVWAYDVLNGYEYDDLAFAIYVTPDTTPPVLSLPDDMSVEATAASGATVAFVASATDAVDGPVPVTCEPASGRTFPLGTTTVTCSATDAAGNTATASFEVSVTYSWSGVLQPINGGSTANTTDDDSVFKLGSTVPVKFRLSGDSAGITDATAKLTVAKVSNGVVGDEIEAVSTSQATTGNLFRYDEGSPDTTSDDQYIFNWGTKGLQTGVGTYQLKIDLGDGTSNAVLVSLK
jgi:hypothetical protein